MEFERIDFCKILVLKKKEALFSIDLVKLLQSMLEIINHTNRSRLKKIMSLKSQQTKTNNVVVIIWFGEAH